ncbi:hypothetical protein [uncultured Gilvimarinus sp.]|uniref:hypothetical protein n=1 Tax=uncultured Gilvimarinus sp. TaxID=1689143 RepID=UPI0030EC5551
MKINRPALVIAIAFFIFWLSVLYAGADHPPPAGFAWLILIVAICSLVVYLRLPCYWQWAYTRRSMRKCRVLLDGAIAGATLAIGFFVFAPPGDAHFAAAGVFDYLLWVTGLTVVGAVNAAAVYAITVLLKRCRLMPY